MNIGIIGSGSIGATAARLFTQAGHAVALSNSRGPATLADLVAGLGPKAHAATAPDAARFGEVVLVAIPFGRYADLPAEALSGKIVIDAGNYYPPRDGRFPELDGGRTTSSEMVAAHLPGARVVKAFNTINSEHLGTQGDPALPIEERRAIFVAGDDADAKRLVSGLIEEIGYGAVDTGSLRDGGPRQQPDSPVYNREMTVQEARAATAPVRPSLPLSRR